MKILVTGANGQLGRSIQKISKLYPKFEFIYTDVEQLDITNLEEVNNYFKKHKPKYCINAAAYTQVDKAEKEKELNNKINIIGPKNLAIASKENNAILIHISSDYVYHNENTDILTETSPTNPKGIYAISKLLGEQEVISNLSKFYIIRTSWLYSEFGSNFVKTMIKYGSERDELNVVNDQIGSPTYATDLADTVLKFIEADNSNYGIYNYSNSGYISWYDFANKIMELTNIKCKINPIPSSEYPTPTPRPLNSKLLKEKIVSELKINIPSWDNALHRCISTIIDKK